MQQASTFKYATDILLRLRLITAVMYAASNKTIADLKSQFFLFKEKI